MVSVFGVVEVRHDLVWMECAEESGEWRVKLLRVRGKRRWVVRKSPPSNSPRPKYVPEVAREWLCEIHHFRPWTEPPIIHQIPDCGANTSSGLITKHAVHI